ncbi:hypothetical protein DSECCO2_487590 [anaerobic digester metagenome]
MKPSPSSFFQTSPPGKVSSMPSMSPMPRIAAILSGYCVRTSSNSAWAKSPMRAARSASRSSRMMARVLVAAAETSAPPPNVVAWEPGTKPAAAASVASTAPMGSPLARALEQVKTSGSTP